MEKEWMSDKTKVPSIKSIHDLVQLTTKT